MSIEKIKKKISIIRQMISVLQKMLVLVSSKSVVVIIHHTATLRDKTHFDAINNNHKVRGYPKSKFGFYCAYNTLIEGNGKINLARSYQETGHATSRFKSFHIDICLTGNFDTEQPVAGQLEALHSELVAIQYIYGSYELKVHQDYANTACCGTNLIKVIKQINI